MKGYKAFDADWTCRGFQYEIGKTYELPEGEELKICDSGFHFCKNPIDVFAYYPYNKNTKIAEIEALGDIRSEGTKYVTNKIKIVKEFTRGELEELIADDGRNTGSDNSGSYNSGKYNSGNCNSGDCNSGNCNDGSMNTGSNNRGNSNSGYGNYGNNNTGDENTGSRNTGYCNQGYRNSGDYNSGSFNAGDNNSGYRNTGSDNSGNYNSGNYNSGDYNSGCYNSGNCNSGDYNSGYRNTGNWNSGDYNSGIFNTVTPCMMSFNAPTSISFDEFIKTLDYNFYHLCFRIGNKTLRKEDHERIRNLPNFDAKIFKEITGIDIDDEERENG